MIDLGGKPLISWTIECAKKSKAIERIVVSTDCEDISNYSLNFGCEVPFKRPAELSNDSASSIDVILHALDNIPGKFDSFALLQPTSPFRSPEDIEGCISLRLKHDADSVFSVCESPNHPYLMFKSNHGLAEPWIKHGIELSRIRTQDMPNAYIINGAVYTSTVEKFRKNRSFFTNLSYIYEMPVYRSIDIDTESDLEHARTTLYQKQI